MTVAEDIYAGELLKRLQNGEQLNLIDVREPIEFATFNIGGTNIPLSKLDAAAGTLLYHQNEEIIVICKMGLRSETGQQLLRAQVLKTCVTCKAACWLCIKSVNVYCYV